jgi:succinate dehydrogenase / fumarate reductase cytochrome b subunit
MTEVILKKQRPKHLALNQIRLPCRDRLDSASCERRWPVPDAAGAAFAVRQQRRFARILCGLQGRRWQYFVKLLLLGLLWAYLHHFCAGIRFLLLDMHVGIEKEAARSSAASC